MPFEAVRTVMYTLLVAMLSQRLFSIAKSTDARKKVI